jgi:hypothetical protein
MLSYFKNLLLEIVDEIKRMAVEVVMKTFDDAALQAQGTIAKVNEMLITSHRECFQSIRNILTENRGHSATLDPEPTQQQPVTEPTFFGLTTHVDTVSFQTTISTCPHTNYFLSTFCPSALISACTSTNNNLRIHSLTLIFTSPFSL